MVGAGRRHGVYDDAGVMASLLTRSPCPVWVQVGAPRPVERILVPVDLGELRAAHPAELELHEVGLTLFDLEFELRLRGHEPAKIRWLAQMARKFRALLEEESSDG